MKSCVELEVMLSGRLTFASSLGYIPPSCAASMSDNACRTRPETVHRRAWHRRRTGGPRADRGTWSMFGGIAIMRCVHARGAAITVQDKEHLDLTTKVGQGLRLPVGPCQNVARKHRAPYQVDNRQPARPERISRESRRSRSSVACESYLPNDSPCGLSWMK